MPYFILFDNVISGTAKLYQNYSHTCFLTSDQLVNLDNLLQQGWQKNLHVAIFADHELGLPLQNLPKNYQGTLALHWFKQSQSINSVENWLANQIPENSLAGINTPQANIEKQHYLDAIHNIQSAIACGETYQINYTTRLHLNSYGHPIKLYQRLRQPVPYAALSFLPNQNQADHWTLCFSPELFLKINSDGLITTKPMKGTAPILNDGQDQQRAIMLQSDIKNRAENVMIVDLLRNDLGKIAETGQVTVPAPFEVSQFGSVWQMTTTVTAKAKPNTKVSDILQAAFPCGSITGAPKRMSMSIIDQLETEPRGLYTGSMGWLAPCLSGLRFHGCLNVVIRTLQLTEQRPSEKNSTAHALYQGIYGVGSGIVADSVAESEYEECGWKAHFLTSLRPEFSLFETMRVTNKKCALLSAHLHRLTQSAQQLNFEFNKQVAQDKILNYLKKLPDNSLYRVKAELTVSDGLLLQHAVCHDFQESEQSVLIYPYELPVQDFLRRFKTSCRTIFDDAWKTAEKSGAFDSLLFNTNHILLEGGRSSVFVRFGNEWHTPSLDLDILSSVMRKMVIQSPQQYLEVNTIYEHAISREELLSADEIRLCNALRGIFPVKLKN